MITRWAGFALLAYAASGRGYAIQLITNGGFETGTLSGWVLTNQTGSCCGTSFYSDRLTTTPLSADPTAGPESGNWYAVSDNAGGPGTAILSQTFTVPTGASSVILSYGLFVNSFAGDVVDPAGNLDYSGPANQYALVSLLTGAVTGANLFSTSTGVVRDFYKGTDGGAITNNPYKDYSFDITSLVGSGGMFTLRFAEVNNLDVLNMGVDNVSVSFTAVSATPEPASIMLAALGMAGIGVLRRRRPDSIAQDVS